MRKVIVSLNVTADGFAAGPNGELDWAVMEEEIAKDVEATSTASTILMGRVTYDMMVQYWPTAPADSSPFVAMMNENPKIVFSKTIDEAPWGEWTPATVVDNLAETVNALKAEEGEDMVILGGPGIIAAFAEHDLIDEYHININPIAIGRGMPLFPASNTPLRLKLLETKPYPSGVIGVKYAVVRE